MSGQNGGRYAGDIDAQTAFQELAKQPDAQLIDVRTREEWTFVGLPDLSGIGKEPLLIEWQIWPAMQVASDFPERLKVALAERGVPGDAPLYFLCRSGGRSAAAASISTANGFGTSYNVVGGFEGPPDPERHRGTVDGWKAHGLPWRQS
ncbi:rhodanese-like domain-containing protein [Terrihabitans sp. B22-R8]|uniref:rhodanese-like domain-containing protein n=1 Tax=Terrihabitans sp. B22-R8 TaxID=3425128 RepID=UPI00403CC62C